MIETSGKYTEAKIMIDDVEENALNQIKDMVNHEAFDKPVRIMPDTHWGKGAVIGFTMPLNKENIKIAPSTIGVDIGCGVQAANLGKTKIDNLNDLDKKIRDAIPMGFNVHNRGYEKFEDFMIDFEWDQLEGIFDNVTKELGFFPHVSYGKKYFGNLCKRAGENRTRAINSMGTLGGGNHFIELSRDSSGNLWCVVHSGSRGIGNKTAQYWMNKATEQREDDLARFKNWPKNLTPYINDDGSPDEEKIRYDYEGKEIEEMFNSIKRADSHPEDDRNKNLDYLRGVGSLGYFRDMIFLQVFAQKNRSWMVNKVADILDCGIIRRIDSVHNYIDFNDYVIRKGATPARCGQAGVIPLNMKDGAILFVGKGNSEWNQSVCHGAGRIMGRKEAKRTLEASDVFKEMEGVFTTNIPLDEAPGTYKSASMIQNAIEPTAGVFDILKPVMNIKA